MPAKGGRNRGGSARRPLPARLDASDLVRRVEDSMRRPVTGLDLQAIRRLIEGRNVMVTGAAGSIGSEVSVHLLGHNPARLLLLDSSESGLFELVEHRLAPWGGRAGIEPIIADVRDERRIARVFRDEVPDVVVHAAAIKHVPLTERQPLEALKTNVLGTHNVATSARASGTESFVYLSTDKAEHPTNFMGQSKRLGEVVVRATFARTRTRHCIIRFCNVVGSRGSVVPLFANQIAHGRPLRITHKEMERYFITKEEAVALILQAGAICRAGETYVLDADGAVNIVALANRMLELAGSSPADGRVEYIGPRLGEKMHEEAIHRAPGLERTDCPRLLRSTPEPVDRNRVGRLILDLRRAVDEEWGPERLAERMAQGVIAVPRKARDP